MTRVPPARGTHNGLSVAGPTSRLWKASQLVWTDGFYPVEINEVL